MKVLDCTLRDGGYCNNWNFGAKNILKIINCLVESNIDIIECGFLSNKVEDCKGNTRYNSIEQMETFVPKNKGNSKFVCMINYGEYEFMSLPRKSACGIDGIRIAFHKRNVDDALKMAKIIKEKGYDLFLQPMVSLNYTDEDFLDLIKRSNDLNPYAFYIVDSFGVMKQRDLVRLFYLVEHNLKENILIGFHSHNNMQLAYSNAQELLRIGAKHDVIIDSSVFGMGRGAGNLNTELFVEYANDNIGTDYKLPPLLSIIDEVLSSFHKEKYWGYSLPNYLSAKYNTHPNYAKYLDDKNSLTYENMNDIFQIMEDEKRVSYDEHYIEGLYERYMENGLSQNEHLEEIKKQFFNSDVLIIAPGKSSIDESEKIISFCNENKDVIVISVNMEYTKVKTDYVFVSNIRRYKALDEMAYGKCITTSNISSVDVYLKVKYGELLNRFEAVRDNAGMMLIKFLIKMNCKHIYLAGMDGYTTDNSENYAEEQMKLFTRKAMIQSMNEGMNSAIEEFSHSIGISFLTTPKYINCIL